MDKTHNVDWKILDTKEYILYDSVSIKSKQAKLIYAIWSWDSRYPGGVQWLEGGRKGASGVSEWVVFFPLIVTWSILFHLAVLLNTAPAYLLPSAISSEQHNNATINTLYKTLCWVCNKYISLLISTKTLWLGMNTLIVQMTKQKLRGNN